MSSAEAISAGDNESGYKCRTSVDLSSLTTVSVGGSAKTFYDITEREGLLTVSKQLASRGVPLFILGAGSNSLFPDGEFELPIIKLGREFKDIVPLDGGRFQVGAAVGLMRLARLVSSDGFSGLEFAAGIPATVGGAIKMNAGAHGGEIGERVVRVECFSQESGFFWIPAQELSFSYRSSSIPDGTVITKVELALTQSSKELVEPLLVENLEYRKQTQPLTLPSFGSTFRNPESHSQSAGVLIEQCGLKGYTIGNAEISGLHANWVINPTREASYEEVTSLLRFVKDKVFQRFGVHLREEVIDWASRLNC